MITFYSACEMKKTGLSLSALTQGIRSEIDLVTFVVKPEDFMAMIFKFKSVKFSGIDTEEFEHLAFCEQGPQVNDTGKPILPDDLDNAEYDRLRTMHSDYVS